MRPGHAEQAKRFLSGYARSLEDWEAPAHQSVRAFQEAMFRRSRKEVRQALAGMQDAGWNLNEFVIQDHPNSWFNLAPFFLSKGNRFSADLFRDFIRMPGVDLNLQRARVYDYSLSHRKDNVAVVKPFIHSFLVGWAIYLGPLPPSSSKSIDVQRCRLAQELLAELEPLSLDWNQCDSQGNSILHAMFQYASGATCLNLMPWLLDRGVNTQLRNENGQTPTMLAMDRLTSGKIASGNRRSPERADYEQALAVCEEHQLAQATSTPIAGQACRRGPRL